MCYCIQSRRTFLNIQRLPEMTHLFNSSFKTAIATPKFGCTLDMLWQSNIKNGYIVNAKFKKAVFVITTIAE